MEINSIQEIKEGEILMFNKNFKDSEYTRWFQNKGVNNFHSVKLTVYEVSDTIIECYFYNYKNEKYDCNLWFEVGKFVREKKGVKYFQYLR